MASPNDDELPTSIVTLVEALETETFDNELSSGISPIFSPVHSPSGFLTAEFLNDPLAQSLSASSLPTTSVADVNSSESSATAKSADAADVVVVGYENLATPCFNPVSPAVPTGIFVIVSGDFVSILLYLVVPSYLYK